MFGEFSSVQLRVMKAANLCTNILTPPGFETQHFHSNIRHHVHAVTQTSNTVTAAPDMLSGELLHTAAQTSEKLFQPVRSNDGSVQANY